MRTHPSPSQGHSSSHAARGQPTPPTHSTLPTAKPRNLAFQPDEISQVSVVICKHPDQSLRTRKRSVNSPRAQGIHQTPSRKRNKRERNTRTTPQPARSGLSFAKTRNAENQGSSVQANDLGNVQGRKTQFFPLASGHPDTKTKPWPRLARLQIPEKPQKPQTHFRRRNSLRPLPRRQAVNPVTRRACVLKSP